MDLRASTLLPIRPAAEWEAKGEAWRELRSFDSTVLAVMRLMLLPEAIGHNDCLPRPEAAWRWERMADMGINLSK